MVDAAPVRRAHFGAGSWLLLIVVVVICAIFGLMLYQRQNDVQPRSGPAPMFELETFEGEKISLDALRGKVVFINFWASWCPPCRAEAPMLEALWQRYGASGDVVFIGIAYADNGPRSREFLAEFNVTYPNGPDLETRISDAYHIEVPPESFVIDQNGQIARFILGQVSEAVLTDTIDTLLAGQATS